MSLPNTSQLVAKALRELAAAEHAWLAALRLGDDRLVKFQRVDRALDEIKRLACMLYPAKAEKPKPVREPKAPREPKPRALPLPRMLLLPAARGGS